MKVENIKKIGKKYKIEFEDGKNVITYEEVILENGLLYHKYINDKLYKKIIEDTRYYNNYNKVLDMISRRLRSEYEITEYLKKSNTEDKDIKKITDNLKRIDLINDKNYAKAYTNDRINLSYDGPYKIKKHLEEKKVKEEYIEEALLNIDEKIILNHIEKIIDKKIKSNTKYTPYILKQKLNIYLINLGYSRESVNQILENKTISTPNLEKEMDKILNKLKKKYSGSKLVYNLKGKLYAKGYTKEEIDEYLKDSSLI